MAVVTNTAAAAAADAVVVVVIEISILYADWNKSPMRSYSIHYINNTFFGLSTEKQL